MANDNAFVRRIQIAVGRFASYVLNEDPGTPNHAPRYAWSRNAILNTLPIASALAPTIVMNSVVAAKLAGTSDAEIQSAVEVQIALLML